MRREGGEAEHLKVVDGDDRSQFLKHNPYDLLYWWAVMDKYNILWFCMSKMDDENSASSGKTPSTVARKKQKTDSRTASKASAQVQEIQKEMSMSFAHIGRSMETVAFRGLSAELESNQHKKFDLQLKRMDVLGDKAKEALFDERIAQLDHNIARIEEQLDSNGVGPTRIRFEDREPSSTAEDTEV